jgi:hypothetical protein
MIRLLLALSALLLSVSAYAQPPRHHRDGKPLRIVIETIPHSQRRYPTVGDWQFDKAGDLHITVSKMSDQRYEFLVAAHEMIEAYLAIHAGVSPTAVDRFDKAYEANRKPGDDSEPAVLDWQGPRKFIGGLPTNPVLFAVGFAADSALEGDGFELSVPGR